MLVENKLWLNLKIYILLELFERRRSQMQFGSIKEIKERAVVGRKQLALQNTELYNFSNIIGEGHAI